MGILDKFWATQIVSRVLESQRLTFEQMSERQIQTLGMLALSLKKDGMNKDQTTDALNQLAAKHGGLHQALNFYSEHFGI